LWRAHRSSRGAANEIGGPAQARLRADAHEGLLDPILVDPHVPHRKVGLDAVVGADVEIVAEDDRLLERQDPAELSVAVEARGHGQRRGRRALEPCEERDRERALVVGKLEGIGGGILPRDADADARPAHERDGRGVREDPGKAERDGPLRGGLVGPVPIEAGILSGA